MRYWMVSSQQSKQSNNEKKIKIKEKNTTHKGLVKMMVPPPNFLWPPRRLFFGETTKENGFGMDKRDNDM